MNESKVRKNQSISFSNKSIHINKELAKLNKHINFKREGTKSSPRKTPTQVTCCKCKKVFVLPFKPRKPEIYCDECFSIRTKKVMRN